MKLIWSLIAVLLVAGCGVGADGPTPGGEAPTGVAPGVTLYFVDGQGRLQPDQRDTDRLGSVADAVSLLLTGPGEPGLRTEIAESSVKRVTVTTEPELIQLTLPLARNEVTQLGIDQIVCTAIGVHVQSGGPRTAKVRLRFTMGNTESDVPRACPLIN